MPEDWKKFIQKQSASHRERLFQVVMRIVNNDLRGLDIIKMKGYQNSYRCRIGSIRIIFTRSQENMVRIIAIDKRGDIYK